MSAGRPSSNDPPAADAPARSKSAAKREHRAIQNLVETLAGLAPARLAGIGLDADLATEIEHLRGLTRGARARQVRHAAKQLSLAGLEPSVLEARVAEVEGRGRAASARLKRVERWRQRLVDEGDQALEALVAEHPGLDRQRLRNLVRRVRRDRASGRSSGAARELFRYVRDLGESGRSDPD